MLSGSLVVPNKIPRPRKDYRDISRESPYGGLRSHGENDVKILYVCHNMVHRDLVAYTFRDRAMYILPGAMVTGRRFTHVVTFEQFVTPASYWDWFNGYLCTNFDVHCERTYYTLEQQYELGIVNHVGFDLASDYIAERKQLLTKHGAEALTQGVFPKGT